WSDAREEHREGGESAGKRDEANSPLRDELRRKDQGHGGEKQPCQPAAQPKHVRTDRKCDEQIKEDDIFVSRDCLEPHGAVRHLPVVPKTLECFQRGKYDEGAQQKSDMSWLAHEVDREEIRNAEEERAAKLRKRGAHVPGTTAPNADDESDDEQ